jgi:hypothetical protein
MNIATLTENIANDLQQGLPRDLVIQYWNAKAGSNSPTSRQESPQRPRAVAASPKLSVTSIRKADADDILSMFCKVAEKHSYVCIAKAMYGADQGHGCGGKIAQWVNGIISPQNKSIERMRTFLIEFAKGQHELQAARKRRR